MLRHTLLQHITDLQHNGNNGIIIIIIIIIINYGITPKAHHFKSMQNYITDLTRVASIFKFSQTQLTWFFSMQVKKATTKNLPHLQQLQHQHCSAEHSWRQWSSIPLFLGQSTPLYLSLHRQEEATQTGQISPFLAEEFLCWCVVSLHKQSERQVRCHSEKFAFWKNTREAEIQAKEWDTVMYALE